MAVAGQGDWVPRDGATPTISIPESSPRRRVRLPVALVIAVLAVLVIGGAAALLARSSKPAPATALSAPAVPSVAQPTSVAAPATRRHPARRRPVQHRPAHKPAKLHASKPSPAPAAVVASAAPATTPVAAPAPQPVVISSPPPAPSSPPSTPSTLVNQGGSLPAQSGPTKGIGGSGGSNH